MAAPRATSQVIAPGGTQRVEWRDDGIYLTGWAEVVFDGHWVLVDTDLPETLGTEPPFLITSDGDAIAKFAIAGRQP